VGTDKISIEEKEPKKLLDLGETETLEFKEKLNKSFYKTISAFANTKGGIILLGVEKNGIITGVEASARFLENLTNRIVKKIPICPEIEPINMK
jgi:ATP-dependent DNA helicase RecG